MSEPFVIEGEQTLREGETRTPAVVFEDFATVTTGGTEVYVNGSTQSATWLSGSSVATANVLTLPLITVPAGSGGLTVVVEPRVTANGQSWKTGIVFRVLKPGSQR